jgi:hypothetical protein
MTELNSQQKELLFDYCLGLTTEDQNTQAKQLIASNRQAAEVYSKLKVALSPLKNLKTEPCPDSLVEGTVWRLNNLARSSQLRLQQLLADEQAKGIAEKGRFWKNLGEILAAAAVIVFAFGVLAAPLNLARQKSRQEACLMQLQRIGQGLSSYSSDHDGQPPAVASAMGAPWWKVGYQGKENQSNTRHIWLLVKGGYVKPADFVCPGRSGYQIVQLDPSQIQSYNDFPSKNYVTYSFRIKCSKPGEETPQLRRLTAADANPLFEKLPTDFSKQLKLEPNIDLLLHNSINHNNRGQNVLFGDGAAEFVTSRQIGASQDDIFTLQDTDTYKGVEVPSSGTDAFLAP